MNEITLERRALALFEAMLEVDEPEQLSWLHEQTRGDEALTRRVTAFILADQQNLMRTGGAADGMAEAEPPQRVGAYRITDKIGAGGMGAVYAAERDSGDFDHEVAVKLIKPGVLSDALIARFHHERQILAQLAHPHIARLFDGGTTQDGQPYFVMERVNGAPLMDWVDSRNPSENERLATFLQICDAVSHAHRNLIIHRDLTPANVLVDDENQVKLIDFGIARPDGDEVTAAPGQALRAMTLTPGFAAPERLRGEAATTLSDIYSAGRLLARMIVKPRAAELQAIINKASASQGKSRYLTIEQLADDIRRYRSGEPVAAMTSAGSSYRLRKWVGRNRPLAALAGLLAVAILSGIAATGFYWYRAEAARADAENRFDEVRGIANFMLFDLYDELGPIAGNTKALSSIADEAKSYLERLTAGDDQSPDLRLEIAQGYHRLSDVSGNPEGANLGRRDDARKFIDTAIADLEALHSEYPSNRKYTQALADAHHSDAILLFIGEDDNEGGLNAATRSAELLGLLLETNPDDKELRFAWWISRLQAAKPYIWVDRGEEGVALLKSLLEEVRAASEDEPDNKKLLHALAGVYAELGYQYSWIVPGGKPQEEQALPPFDKAIKIKEDLLAIASNEEEREQLRGNLIGTLFQRSLVLSDIPRYPAALADLERAEQYSNAAIKRDPDDQGALRRLEAAQSQKIYVLIGLGRSNDAVELARSVLNSRAKLADDEPDNRAYRREMLLSAYSYAETLAEIGKPAEACIAFRETLSGWKSFLGGEDPSPIDQSNLIGPLEKIVEECG